MWPLTIEELENPKSQNVCYICEVKFDHEEWFLRKVKDHCHCNGKYKISTHSYCNPNHAILDNFQLYYTMV